MVLPLPEPPHEDVRELNEQIVTAQHELAEATMRLAWIHDLNRRSEFVPLTQIERMRRRVMVRVREVAVAAWSEELDALQQRARALGLQP